MNRFVEEKFGLTGRVAILTGGGGMLGREFARVLMEAGAKVVIADILAEPARRAAEEATARTGGEALAVTVDVSNPADVKRLVQEARDRWDRIDILINNAGIDPKFDADIGHLQSHAFEEYPIEAWRKSLDVNLTGTFLCSQAVGKAMVRQGSGVIVNVCSIYGLVGPDQRLYKQDGEGQQQLFKPASYSVAKAGVAQLTRYLASYWAGKKIRVNTLTPGGVYNAQDDEFVRKYSERTPLARMAYKEEMCSALLFLVSDASSYMTGANLVIDGGWTAW